ncbi:hypothetical protein F66182_4793 [Fusarium sp. NRRL 66182]|nr:hypothetical protein F66182_4793 [Fusarium sp. NRRL 66182]
MGRLLEMICNAAWQTVRYVVTIMPAGTLLGAGVALRLPRHTHLDVVIILLLAVSGITSILVHASSFQEARLGRFAIVVALGCIFSRFHCLTESPTPVAELITGLRDYALIMAVVSSVVAMIMPGEPRRRQQSETIAGEEGKPRDTFCKPSAKRSLDVASSTSYPDFLSDVGSLDFKYMTGPKSHYSEYSCSEDSVLTLSSGLVRDPSLIPDIVHWAKTGAPAAFGGKGDSST